MKYLITILFLLASCSTNMDAKFMSTGLIGDAIPYDLTYVFVSVNKIMLPDTNAPRNVINPIEHDVFGVAFRRGSCTNYTALYRHELIKRGWNPEDLINSYRWIMQPWGEKVNHAYLTVLGDDGVYHLDNLNRVVIKQDILSYLTISK